MYKKRKRKMLNDILMMAFFVYIFSDRYVLDILRGDKNGYIFPSFIQMEEKVEVFYA